MMLSLIDVLKQKGELERKQAYWNTYHCLSKVYVSEGRLYGKYCKNRFCSLCCGIRKAEIIKRYFPIMKKWEAPFFLTITVKSATSHELNSRVNEMFRIFRLIVNKYKKRNQRGKGIKLIGVKSFECNFNPLDQTYNPHFHLILPNLKIADTIMTEWRKQWQKEWGKKFVTQSAQCNIKVKDLENCLIEIIKYSSKIFTEPDVVDKSKKQSPLICVAAYDNIICAMKKHHIFGHFGFDLPKADKVIKGKTSTLTQYQELKFDSKQFDWVNVDSDEILSGFLPTPELSYLLENNFNMALE